MSREKDDDNIVVQGNVGETTQVQEEEQIQKQNGEKENVEVAEGQELEVLPKNEEEKQDILLTEAISTTPKRPKLAKTKSSVRSQHKEKNLANVSQQLQKQSAKIEFNKVAQMLQPLQKYLKSAKKQAELIKELALAIAIY
jgi:hypothetical protein